MQGQIHTKQQRERVRQTQEFMVIWIPLQKPPSTLKPEVPLLLL